LRQLPASQAIEALLAEMRRAKTNAELLRLNG
jgi:hypothetical protein